MVNKKRAKKTSVSGRLVSMTTEYNVRLGSSSFDLPERRSELLRALREVFRGMYLIDAEDVAVRDGSTLSDYRISVRLFNNMAQIDVSPETLTMKFQDLPGLDFLPTLCGGCILPTIETVFGVLSESDMGLVTIETTLNLELDVEHSVQAHLNKYTKKIPFDFSTFGRNMQNHDLKFDVESHDNSWIVFFHAYGEISQKFQLALSCHVLYDQNGEIRGLDKQTEHMVTLMKTLLPQIGVSLQ